MRLHYLTLSIITIFAFSQSFAQCPSSSRSGIHVVQKGETLYAISRKYSCSLQDIYRWNNMQANDILPICKELIVNTPHTSKGGSTITRQNYPPDIAYRYQRKAGSSHIVRQGEQLTSLAEYYGYTENRFRRINGLRSGERIYEGQSLQVSDCVCPKKTNPNLTYQDSPTLVETTTSRSTADPYGFDDRRITSPKTSITTTNTNKANSNSTSTTASNAAYGYPFMTETEMDMVKEINLIRSNPPAYVPYIESYISKLRQRGRYGTAVQSANELIQELKRTPQLTYLEPTECIYTAAKEHGLDRLEAGSNDHKGTDGSWPWDRIRRACPQITEGNENLVGGPESVREAVILLLVDDGISTRGHRKTLLNPKWNYVACYKIGKVGYMPNSWVQNFGQ